jgi:hypothetical protein
MFGERAWGISGKSVMRRIDEERWEEKKIMMEENLKKI